MIKTIIIDDEPLAIENLRSTLQRLNTGLEVVGTAANIDDGFDLICQQRPDLVFSDIEMPGGSGLDLIRQLRNVDTEVIFVTAYDQFALQALKAEALDYILKPLVRADLLDAVEKAKKKISEKKLLKKVDPLNNIQAQEGHKQNNLTKLAVPSSEGYIFIPFHDILYCESDGRYSIVHMLKGGKQLVTKTLGDIEENLDERQFVRIHNKYIVNINYVSKYVRGRGGIVVLENSKELDVSERKKEYFLKLFGE